MIPVSLKIAKLFVVGSNSSSIRDAVDLACCALGVAQLDSVIIAPPPAEDGTSLSLEYLQPYWQELENLVKNKKIVAIGTSDLDKTLLEQLYLWAQRLMDGHNVVQGGGGSKCDCHLFNVLTYRPAQDGNHR